MRAGPELQLHEQVTGLAEILGWEWMAVRPMFDVKRKVYRTGTIGTMAKGWCDLVLVRSRDRRLLFVELKGTKRDKPTPDQERVLGVLRALELGDVSDEYTWATKIEVYVWRP